jgi:hypothetical protein
MIGVFVLAWNRHRPNGGFGVWLEKMPRKRGLKVRIRSSWCLDRDGDGSCRLENRESDLGGKWSGEEKKKKIGDTVAILLCVKLRPIFVELLRPSSTAKKSHEHNPRHPARPAASRCQLFSLAKASLIKAE